MNGWLPWKRFAENTIFGNTMLNQDFKEFIQLLNDNSVQYLVVGGYAVAFHGHPRYTKDLDVWIWLDADNANKVVEVLNQFGFGSLDIRAEDFLEPDHIIQLGYPPVRIDLITTLPGVNFQECWKARVDVVVDEVHLKVIDLENLKKNKRASGRLQDLADLENLE
jgi:hypothetical protein